MSLIENNEIYCIRKRDTGKNQDEVNTALKNKNEGDDEENEKLIDKSVCTGTVLGDELAAIAQNAATRAENVVRKVAGWSVQPFHNLPRWLKDNDYLLFGHRPPLPSFDECFKSIFRLHTETGNIWTHLIGCLAFIGIATYFHLWAKLNIEMEERIVFGVFFLGAIGCLAFSTLFHTVNCHSEFIGSLFLKLDYCGIVLLIVGSYVPWLYFVFYCHYKPKIVYTIMMCTLGITSIIVSLWDKFSHRKLRTLRAIVFITFALSGIIPTIHFGFIEGWFNIFFQKSVFWLFLSGLLYLIGTTLYAMRVPERFFPGKFDIWLHSHQIFHLFVIGGALVHYFGLTEVAMHRLSLQSKCTNSIFS